MLPCGQYVLTSSTKLRLGKIRSNVELFSGVRKGASNTHRALLPCQDKACRFPATRGNSHVLNQGASCEKRTSSSCGTGHGSSTQHPNRGSVSYPGRSFRAAQHLWRKLARGRRVHHCLAQTHAFPAHLSPTWLLRCCPPSPACAPLMAQAAGVGVGTIRGPLTMSPAPTNLICKAHKICLQSLNATGSCFCTTRYASQGLQCRPQLSLGISGSYSLPPFQWTKIYAFLIVFSFCLEKNGLAAASSPQGT